MLIVASTQCELKILDPEQGAWIEGPPSPRAIRLLSTPGAIYGLKDDGTIIRLRY
jgi:hypothetical protein